MKLLETTICQPHSQQKALMAHLPCLIVPIIMCFKLECACFSFIISSKPCKIGKPVKLSREIFTAVTYCRWIGLDLRHICDDLNFTHQMYPVYYVSQESSAYVECHASSMSWEVTFKLYGWTSRKRPVSLPSDGEYWQLIMMEQLPDINALQWTWQCFSDVFAQDTWHCAYSSRKRHLMFEETRPFPGKCFRDIIALVLLSTNRTPSSTTTRRANYTF